MPNLKIKRKLQRRIKNIQKENADLQISSKKIIASLNQEDWPNKDLKSNEMLEQINQPLQRAAFFGSAGGMAGLIPLSYIQNLISFLSNHVDYLKAKDVQTYLFAGLALTSYLSAGYIATQATYHFNGFWNPFSSNNKLYKLSQEYKKNCQEIEKLETLISPNKKKL
jgi:hypothetical protein